MTNGSIDIDDTHGDVSGGLYRKSTDASILIFDSIFLISVVRK